MKTMIRNFGLTLLALNLILIVGCGGGVERQEVEIALRSKGAQRLARSWVEVDLRRRAGGKFAEQDHLVPPDASRAMKGAISSKDYTELSFPGGHIGIYVSGKAQAIVPPAIAEWLDSKS